MIIGIEVPKENKTGSINPYFNERAIGIKEKKKIENIVGQKPSERKNPIINEFIEFNFKFLSFLGKKFITFPNLKYPIIINPVKIINGLVIFRKYGKNDVNDCEISLPKIQTIKPSKLNATIFPPIKPSTSFQLVFLCKDLLENNASALRFPEIWQGASVATIPKTNEAMIGMDCVARKTFIKYSTNWYDQLNINILHFKCK